MQKKHKIALAVVVVLAIIGFGAWSMMGGNTASPQNAAGSASTNETLEVITSVAKLMLIPDEKPVIATINEAEKLILSQPFYIGAINGDKLVMFPNAKKAVIYSPTRNLIVNSGPFVIGSGPQAQ